MTDLAARTRDTLAAAAGAIVGDAHVVADARRLEAWSVDGVRPALGASPADAEETAALLRAAGETQAGVLPRGGGAHQHLGSPPARADLIVDTTRLVGITDYTPADYVVAVRAGTRFRDLQQALRAERQWLPLDPPGAGEATMGGLIAANRNGPRRLFWGSIRDLLIGIRVALPTGEVIKAGGKVVKNVAGYDLVKLFIGSHGAAGVITEATFKVSPHPGDGVTVLALVPGAGAAHALVTAVLRSYLLPSALEVANPPALARLARAAGLGEPPAGAWGVLLLAEGLEESRTRHVSETRTLAAASAPDAAVEVLTGGAHDALWSAVAEFPSPAAHPDGVVCRAGGPIISWVAYVRALDTVGATGPIEILTHAGIGLCYAACGAADGPAAAAALGQAAEAAGGYAVVEVAPPALKPRLPMWGQAPGGLELMRRLRERYDPRAIMVPGRLGWGLS